MLTLNFGFPVQAASESYSKSYTVAHVLSDYQYFVKENLNSSNHAAGAIAVGGTLSGSLSFGEAQVSPSYVKNIEYFNNMNAATNWVGNAKNTKFYYKTASGNLEGWKRSMLTNTGGTPYVDMSTAFSVIGNQSTVWASSSPAGAVADGTVLHINLSSSTPRVTVSAAALKSAKRIQIDGVRLSDFVANEYVISVTGVNGSAFTLDFNTIYLGNATLPLRNALKDLLAGGTEGGQVNLSGMKFIWNFADATGKLTVSGLTGHLVAPFASVDAKGGNFEGGIVAKSLSTDSEGHFYPYNPPKPSTDPSDCTTAPTEPTATTTAPTESTAPTETTAPTEPTATTTAPTETTPPTETTAPTEPTATTTAPTESTTPTETTVPTEPTATTTAPTETTTPTETTVPTEPTATTTAPTETTPPTETTVPTEPTATTTAPTESTTPTETTAPTEPTATTTAPTETTLPTEPTSPTAVAGENGTVPTTSETSATSVPTETTGTGVLGAKRDSVTVAKTGEVGNLLPLAFIGLSGLAGAVTVYRVKRSKK